MPRRVLSGLVVTMGFLCGAAAQTPSAVPVLIHRGPCVMDAIPADAPRYRVTGRVIDDLTGGPIAHATVVLSSLCAALDATEQGARHHWTAQGVSDQEGNFLLDNVPAMAAYLTASHDGYQEIWSFRRAADDPIGKYSIGKDTGPITLRLAPSPSISGVVRGPGGAPLAHAWVTLWCYRTWAGWRRREYCNSLETASDGSYAFTLLQPGRYALVAQPWLVSQEPPRHDAQNRGVGYVPASYPPPAAGGADSLMELAEGQQAHVDFELHEETLHHVTGTVSGREMWPPIVDMVGSNGSKSYVVKIANRCCGFESWVPSGHFSLEAQFTSVDGEFIGSTPMEVRDADVEGVEFPLARRTGVEIPIEIRTVPADNADAMRKVLYLQFVKLRPNGYVESGPQSTMAGWMRPTGALRMESITALPGSYAVALTTTGNVYAQGISCGAADLMREPLVVRPVETPDVIRVAVAEGAMVEGVTRREGNAVRAWVYAVPERADASLLQAIVSDANGKFRLEGLTPGRYLFFASDVEVPLDAHNAAEMSYWQHVGQSLMLEAGKTASLELWVVTP
jgi:hypothetical protein